MTTTNTRTGLTLPPASDTEEFEILPEGLYLMRLKDMTNEGPGRSFDDNSEPKDRIKWVFALEEVISGDDEAEERVGEEAWFWTSLSMHRKATMRGWAEGLLGREIDDNERVDAADLIGKNGRVNIIHYKKLTGDTGHKIASILKAKPGKKARPVVDEEDEESEEPF